MLAGLEGSFVLTRKEDRKNARTEPTRTITCTRVHRYCTQNICACGAAGEGGENKHGRARERRSPVPELCKRVTRTIGKKNETYSPRRPGRVYSLKILL